MAKMYKNEKGFASITVALVLVLVLALLTVSFAKLSRSEQQNALDKQFSTQAYYAAETGINDALKAIKSLPDPTTIPATYANTCAPLPTPAFPGATTPTQFITGSVNDSVGASYTCVMINPKPKTIVSDPVSAGESNHAILTTDAPGNKITVQWGSKTPARNNVFKSGSITNKLPPATSWNSPAVLEFTVTPLDNMTRDGLIANSFTAYLYPSSSGDPTEIAYTSAPSGKGQFVGKCVASPTTDTPCTATINMSSHLSTKYLVSYITYYDDAKVVVSNTLGGVKQEIKGAQAIIDVTGKSRDVLKRTQVRYNYTTTTTNTTQTSGSGSVPGFALQAGNICKRQEVLDTITTYDTAYSPTCDLSN